MEINEEAEEVELENVIWNEEGMEDETVEYAKSEIKDVVEAFDLVNTNKEGWRKRKNNGRWRKKKYVKKRRMEKNEDETVVYVKSEIQEGGHTFDLLENNEETVEEEEKHEEMNYEVYVKSEKLDVGSTLDLVEEVEEVNEDEEAMKNMVYLKSENQNEYGQKYSTFDLVDNMKVKELNDNVVIKGVEVAGDDNCEEFTIQGGEISTYCYTPFFDVDLVKWCLQSQPDKMLTISQINEWLGNKFICVKQCGKSSILHWRHRIESVLVANKTKTFVRNERVVGQWTINRRKMINDVEKDLVLLFNHNMANDLFDFENKSGIPTQEIKKVVMEIKKVVVEEKGKEVIPFLHLTNLMMLSLMYRVKLTTMEIKYWISDNFPQYKKEDPLWQQQVDVRLKSSKWFRKLMIVDCIELYLESPSLSESRLNQHNMELWTLSDFGERFTSTLLMKLLSEGGEDGRKHYEKLSKFDLEEWRNSTDSTQPTRPNQTVTELVEMVMKKHPEQYFHVHDLAASLSKYFPYFASYKQTRNEIDICLSKNTNLFKSTLGLNKSTKKWSLKEPKQKFNIPKHIPKKLLQSGVEHEPIIQIVSDPDVVEVEYYLDPETKAVVEKDNNPQGCDLSDKSVSIKRTKNGWLVDQTKQPDKIMYDAPKKPLMELNDLVILAMSNLIAPTCKGVNNWIQRTYPYYKTLKDKSWLTKVKIHLNNKKLIEVHRFTENDSMWWSGGVRMQLTQEGKIYADHLKNSFSTPSKKQGENSINSNYDAKIKTLCMENELHEIVNDADIDIQVAAEKEMVESAGSEMLTKGRSIDETDVPETIETIEVPQPIKIIDATKKPRMGMEDLVVLAMSNLDMPTFEEVYNWIQRSYLYYQAIKDQSWRTKVLIHLNNTRLFEKEHLNREEDPSDTSIPNCFLVRRKLTEEGKIYADILKNSRVMKSAEEKNTVNEIEMQLMESFILCVLNKHPGVPRNSNQITEDLLEMENGKGPPKGKCFVTGINQVLMKSDKFVLLENGRWLIGRKFASKEYMTAMIPQNLKPILTKNPKLFDNFLGRKGLPVTYINAVAIAITEEDVENESKKSDHEKPSIDMENIIDMALIDKGELSLQGLYDWITKSFPYYQSDGIPSKTFHTSMKESMQACQNWFQWQASVRKILVNNEKFQFRPQDENEGEQGDSLFFPDVHFSSTGPPGVWEFSEAGKVEANQWIETFKQKQHDGDVKSILKQYPPKRHDDEKSMFGHGKKRPSYSTVLDYNKSSYSTVLDYNT